MTGMSVKNLETKNDEELLEPYNHATSHGDRIMTILHGRMIGRLISSMKDTSESSDKLSKRIVWLTGIIAFATVIYAVATIVQVFVVS